MTGAPHSKPRDLRNHLDWICLVVGAVAFQTPYSLGHISNIATICIEKVGS